ncbi:MAG TPA: PspA/IM30 family protein [Ktedonobacteraceae bacterium]|nr:PspA/IM30 family protein [Ktedonobacteraceae bacterium]
MNLLERVITLLRLHLNTVVERADDPEKVLRQLHLDMRNQLVQVKTQVATAIAEVHKLQKRSQERKVEAERWLEKAEVAVQQGNDDIARASLTHYNDINKQIQRYQEQKTEQDQLVATMRNVLHQLEAKITEVETTIDLLATRKRNALIQQRVFEVLNKSAEAGEKERVSKAQDALMEAEARARALADLHNRDLTKQLDQLSGEQQIEHQLQALKLQQPGQELLLLHEGQTDIAALLRPDPQLAEPVQRPQPRQSRDLNAPFNVPEAAASTNDLDLERLKRLLDLPSGEKG